MAQMATWQWGKYGQDTLQVAYLSSINGHLVVNAIIDQQGAIIVMEYLISITIQIHLLQLLLLFWCCFGIVGVAVVIL